MNKTYIKPSGMPPAGGPYNHGVRVGDLLFCAGQVAIIPETGKLMAGDIKAQTERALQNIHIILKDQGLTPGHVVKATVFMADLKYFSVMNEVYGRFFAPSYPARTTVQVAALPQGAQVEIEVVAHY